MDSYEATKLVFSRIQNMDPENASKIMGLLLIQDHGEKEMIRLAFGPESLLHSVICKSKKDLGLSNSNTSSRILNGVKLPTPLSIPNPYAFSDDLSSPNSCPGQYSLHRSNVTSNLGHGSSPASTMNSFAHPYFGKTEREADLIDEFQLQDQLSFLNDVPKQADFGYYAHQNLTSSPNGNGDSMPFNGSYGGLHHRRSCSVSDICLNSEDPSGGFGWKPCHYFARGYCKNGTSCKFLHSDSDGVAIGSPNKLDMLENCQELLRSKSFQQQRLASASQLMAGCGSNFNYSPTNKNMNLYLQLLNDSPRASSALMIGDEMHKFSRSPRLERLERNEFSMNPGSRQIYLTFPAESTFREEDVSNYFSIFGPVQDVRIPYQQKRMFGFVTFVYPETVKLILAKGNPHFVCEARVLVKPYKEKGKVPDKFRRQQHMERGEFSACGSLTGLDSKDPFDVGEKMFYSSQDILWRKKLEEQDDMQLAIELQNRRLMGLLLLDVKRGNNHRALSTGASILSPSHSPNFFRQTIVHSSSDRSSAEFPDENGFSYLANNVTVAINQQAENVSEKERDSSSQSDENSNGKASSHRDEENDSQESLEHNLPENLFASPKAAGEYVTAFSNTIEAAKNGTLTLLANNNSMASTIHPATSTLDMASHKSCFFQVPRKRTDNKCKKNKNPRSDL